MKFHPILFSTEMVKAILEGRKTMTRRTIKPQPSESWMNNVFMLCPSGNMYRTNGEQMFWLSDENAPIDKDSEIKCPFGKLGDVLWVREGFNYRHGSVGFSKHIYKADFPDEHPKILRWKPSIHMPKAACRIFLKIKSIRVEQVQSISPGDACDEGINYWNIDGEALEGGELVADYENYTWTEKKEADPNYADRWFPTFANAVDSFRSLWEKINGIDSWKANPWVWVIEFEQISKPKNFN